MNPQLLCHPVPVINHCLRAKLGSPCPLIQHHLFMEIKAAAVSSSADARGTSETPASSAESHLHKDLLQSPPGSQDSQGEHGASPCSYSLCPGPQQVLSLGCVRSMHPSSDCVPRDALRGWSHRGALGRAELPLSHCPPLQYWRWVTSRSHGFREGYGENPTGH